MQERLCAGEFNLGQKEMISVWRSSNYPLTDRWGIRFIPGICMLYKATDADPLAR